MPRYCLYLHDGPTTRAESRYLDLSDQSEAMEMAREALIENQTFSHAEVWTEDRVIVVYHRGESHS